MIEIIEKDAQNSINKLAFYINVFLLFMHLLLFTFYISVNAIGMILINVVPTIIYIFHLRKPKITDRYIKIVFIESWFHMIAAIIAFGWEAGYQNWTYALVCAFFLPSLYPITQRQAPARSYLIGFSFISTYYILYVLTHSFNIKPMQELLDMQNIVLFTINTGMSFLIILVFTSLYTVRNVFEKHELRRRADYDELTSLYNRYSLDFIGQERIDLLKENNSKFDVAIIDIDHFKNINDAYGHKAGDIVLKKIALTLRKFSVKEIKCGRWGGEEFVMISSSYISHEEFVSIIEKLRKYIEKHSINIGDKKIKITISAGIATSKKNLTLEQIVSLADEKLYEAKETGRNKVVS